MSLHSGPHSSAAHPPFVQRLLALAEEASKQIKAHRRAFYAKSGQAVTTTDFEHAELARTCSQTSNDMQSAMSTWTNAPLGDSTTSLDRSFSERTEGQCSVHAQWNRTTAQVEAQSSAARYGAAAVAAASARVQAAAAQEASFGTESRSFLVPLTANRSGPEFRNTHAAGCARAAHQSSPHVPPSALQRKQRKHDSYAATIVSVLSAAACIAFVKARDAGAQSVLDHFSLRRIIRLLLAVGCGALLAWRMTRRRPPTPPWAATKTRAPRRVPQASSSYVGPSLLAPWATQSADAELDRRLPRRAWLEASQLCGAAHVVWLEQRTAPHAHGCALTPSVISALLHQLPRPTRFVLLPHPLSQVAVMMSAAPSVLFELGADGASELASSAPALLTLVVHDHVRITPDAEAVLASRGIVLVRGIASSAPELRIAAAQNVAASDLGNSVGLTNTAHATLQVHPSHQHREDDGLAVDGTPCNVTLHYP